ncbi:EAL domain-containing protein [Bosea sp. TWI1241]|uniref:putative bifunctional diguanylate cyclase/phosphodiesterase n=1 Tax=Bosea sp. TWI1241 TaxID=3148904 RepID=UPI00320B785B
MMRLPDSVARLQSLQNAILVAITRGEPLATVMDHLCRQVEAIAPGVTCSVLARTPDERLLTLAAPSLPSSYAAFVDGLPIGPRVGSCGTAIFRGEQVEVTDIATDPLWDGYRDGVLALGMQACWSSPIVARDARVVGSFAFYYREKRGPTGFERRIVSACVHLCAIAIEHDEVNARNHRLAYFDTLTGLPNRARFNEAITALGARGPSRYGLMMIDIDRLKAVNDTLGHAIGDRLIEAVASRIAGVVGKDNVFRIGGDEFAALLPHCSRAADLRSAASAILRSMQGAVDCDGSRINPSVTMGGTLAGEDGTDVAVLRQNVDFALYHAKEHKRGGFVRFHHELRTSMTRRLQTIRRVDEALNDARIVPHYQPVVHLASGRIRGLEALARLRLANGDIVSAGEFHEALQDPGIGYRLSSQMLSAVAADMLRWQREGIAIASVGINVTAADFLKGDLVPRIVRTFGRARLPLEQLVVEITEQVIMGDRLDGVARTIAMLRERGITVALDDFGTGFASLTHLLDFPVDVIKIDRSFIGGLDTGARSNAIVGALVGMAESLGVRIVAEGIETREQESRLRAMGCELGQGFLYSQAVPTDMVGMLVERLGTTAAPGAASAA